MGVKMIKAYGSKVIPNLLIAVISIVSLSQFASAKSPDWQRSDVDWRLPNGSKITGIYYPKEKKEKLLGREKTVTVKKAKLPADAARSAQQASAGTYANLIEAPPINGFIPWLTVSTTDARKDVDAMEFDAVASSTFGNFLVADEVNGFGIGIFDTGASSHVLSYDTAFRTGIYAADLITNNWIEVTGVTGPVSVRVSQPIGLFFDGLSAIDPCTLRLDTSNLLGQYNVVVSVAPSYEPDVPTAIGTPFAVYYTAVIDNTDQITINRNAAEYIGPSVKFYDNFDEAIPQYSDIIPLELRPLGGLNVQYVPTLDPFDPLNFLPQSPSVIIGNLSQSVFFIHSVDLYERNESAIDKDRFMLDTGAQVSVIGSRIASRLRFNPDYPEFLVEVSGINGESLDVPGFTLDRLVIPAYGDWFIATDVPVILLDVFSPEGGSLDGIIGMNLFTQFNIVLRGGGLFLQPEPTLEIEPIIKITGDIAPEGGDGTVDSLDLQAFIAAFLSEGTMPPSPNWNPKADFAPPGAPDNIINFLDFAIFADHWLESTGM